MSRRLLLLLALLLAPTAALAQTSGWSRPVEIKTTTRSNWFPTLAVDPWGNPHLIFATGTGSGETAKDLLMYTTRRGDAWLAPNDIVMTGTGGWAARSSLAIDRSGRLHLLVRSRDHILYTAADPVQASSAQAWQRPRVMNAIGMPYYAAIAIDPSGILHVVYQELTPNNKTTSCEGCSDVWYRRSLDGGASWSAPRNLSHSAYGSIKLHIMIDSNNNVYVTWDEGKDPNAVLGEPIGIAYTVSRDQGVTWAAPQQLRLDGRAAEQGTLGVTDVGELVQVFRTTPGDELLYRVSDDRGATWSQPAPLPGLVARDRNETPWDRYSLAADSAGNLHLLAVARRSLTDPQPTLFHSVWNADQHAWGAPMPVVNNELLPEWPQLIISNGNRLHATWFTRNRADMHLSDSGAYRVWYSERMVDAPTTTVEIIPTATPVPLPTLLPPVVTPTPQTDTPLVRQARDAPLPVSVRSEAPLLRSLFWALLPTLGILVVAAALILWRRGG
ncbi:sialidase family protein [Kallotenue papyrolyticum]|uniref:sialidase family protein n=1 Tax=Kallotenue papyrolyticum TaxID=1325125 RepID=UPI0004785AC3|nr:sialidase family protein [Kallotenue papyrolyticum]